MYSPFFPRISSVVVFFWGGVPLFSTNQAKKDGFLRATKLYWLNVLLTNSSQKPEAHEKEPRSLQQAASVFGYGSGLVTPRRQDTLGLVQPSGQVYLHNWLSNRQGWGSMMQVASASS